MRVWGTGGTDPQGAYSSHYRAGPRYQGSTSWACTGLLPISVLPEADHAASGPTPRPGVELEHEGRGIHMHVYKALRHVAGAWDGRAKGGGGLLPRSLYLYTCLEAINIHVSLRYRIFINPTNGSGVGKEPKLIQSSELQEFCGL